MTNLQNVDKFTDAINKGTFGIVMVSCTVPSMNKTGNPFYDKSKKDFIVRKLTYSSNIALGYDYAAYLFGKAKKQGVEKSLASFKDEIEKPKGRTWVKHPYILKKDTDEEQKYLRVYYNKDSTKSKSIYLLNGQFVTDARIVAEIESWIKPSNSHSGKFDLDDIILRDFKFENIICLKQGEKVYNKLDCILTPQQMIDFIKKFEEE